MIINRLLARWLLVAAFTTLASAADAASAETGKTDAVKAQVALAIDTIKVL